MAKTKTRKPRTQAAELSLIVPMYNESENIDIFFPAVTKALDAASKNWEIICVDDCSRDDTLAKLKAIHAKNKKIRILSFSRNFGKEAALTAGLHYASGKAVIPIDADLQDPPELIAQMVKKWKEGYKIVLATRRSRNEESWLKQLTAKLFYKIIRQMSQIKLPENTGDFRLLDREIVDIIVAMPERTRLMKGLFTWPGFEPAQLFFDRPERLKGTTSWNYWKLWQLALDGILSFSTVPLKIWTYVGAVISLFSFLYASYLIIRTSFWGVDVPGYASIMVAILFIGGIQLISLGIIGEYVGRIYRETKQRPLFIVRESFGFKGKG